MMSEVHAWEALSLGVVEFVAVAAWHQRLPPLEVVAVWRQKLPPLEVVAAVAVAVVAGPAWRQTGRQRLPLEAEFGIHTWAC